MTRKLTLVALTAAALAFAAPAAGASPGPVSYDLSGVAYTTSCLTDVGCFGSRSYTWTGSAS
jgi:hypothetical protein